MSHAAFLKARHAEWLAAQAARPVDNSNPFDERADARLTKTIDDPPFRLFDFGGLRAVMIDEAHGRRPATAAEWLLWQAFCSLVRRSALAERRLDNLNFDLSNRLDEISRLRADLSAERKYRLPFPLCEGGGGI